MAFQTVNFPSFLEGKNSENILLTAKAIPCSEPQIMNRKLAPCQNPPNNIVVIKLTLVNKVFFLSFENKKVMMKTIVAKTATNKGKTLLL